MSQKIFKENEQRNETKNFSSVIDIGRGYDVGLQLDSATRSVDPNTNNYTNVNINPNLYRYSNPSTNLHKNTRYYCYRPAREIQ